MWRLYSGAAMMHCVSLLVELDRSAEGDHGLTTRILGRVHQEAFLYALYLHFGESPAVERLYQHEFAAVRQTHEACRLWDRQLEAEKRKRRRQLRRVRRTNEGIAKWNAEHPDVTPKPLIPEPHVPQLAPTGIDLSDRMTQFGRFTPRELPVAEVVQALTHLAKSKGFGRESFEPMYLIYRFQSSGGIHPTMSLYDWLVVEGPGFMRIGRKSGAPPLILESLVTALYATAFLVGWVIGDSGLPTPVASELRQRLEPNLSGGRGWAPGI
jgi:hypothetical protein